MERSSGTRLVWVVILLITLLATVGVAPVFGHARVCYEKNTCTWGSYHDHCDQVTGFDCWTHRHRNCTIKLICVHPHHPHASYGNAKDCDWNSIRPYPSC